MSKLEIEAIKALPESHCVDGLTITLMPFGLTEHAVFAMHENLGVLVYPEATRQWRAIQL